MVESTLAEERRDFYVYVIFRADGSPIYVGKGQRHRWLQHAKGSHNKRLARIYAKEGPDLPITKVRERLTDAEAIETEIALIAAIGRGKQGPLVNMTDGGEGLAGYEPTDSHKAKIRAALTGKKRPPEIGEAVRKAWQNISPQRRANMSAAQTGKKASETQRFNQSVSHLARRGKTLEEISRRGHLTRFQRKILNVSVLSKADRAKAQTERNAGNKYGIGNKRTPEGQARVTQSVIDTNMRRNKSGKPTVHKEPQPWLAEGMSRTSWYRNRALHTQAEQLPLSL